VVCDWWLVLSKARAKTLMEEKFMVSNMYSMTSASRLFSSKSLFSAAGWSTA